MARINCRNNNDMFISLCIISWITCQLIDAANYTVEETSRPTSKLTEEEYVRNRTLQPHIDQNLTTTELPLTLNFYPHKIFSKDQNKFPQKDGNVNININLWLPVNFNSSDLIENTLPSIPNSSNSNPIREGTISNLLQKLLPLPLLQDNIISENILPVNNLNLREEVANDIEDTNNSSDGGSLRSSDDEYKFLSSSRDYSRKLIDIINGLTDMGTNENRENNTKPAISKSINKIQNWHENFANNILNIVGNKRIHRNIYPQSRIKRNIYPRVNRPRARPTNIIPRPEDKLPDSFNFNNRVTDILLERFPPNKGFSNFLRPNRFLSTRFTGSGGSSRPSYGPVNDNSIGNRPASSPTSFDDLSLDGSADELHGVDIAKRLGKLDSIFKSLNVDSEACKRKIMCEIARYSDEYSPLAEMIQYETRVTPSLKRSAGKLLDSKAGVRFLSYVDATTRGKDQYKQCDIYKYNCRRTVRDLIDMDSLIVWREVVGWLTVKVLAKD